MTHLATGSRLDSACSPVQNRSAKCYALCYILLSLRELVSCDLRTPCPNTPSRALAFPLPRWTCFYARYPHSYNCNFAPAPADILNVLFLGLYAVAPGDIV